jgi:hypothetical protein
MDARRILAALVLLAAAAAARAQDRPPPSPSPSPSPSPRTVRESVDPVVERMENERRDPCLKAKEEGRPCFPVTATIKGEEYSVRRSLGILGDKPVHTTAPTADEMKEYRPGSQTPIAGVSFDPVCAVKGLLKSLKGKNNVYYLYVVRDSKGDRAQLYDHKLEAETFQGNLSFVGRFEGECAAVAAWRHEDLKLQPAVKGPMPPAPAAASPRPR